MRVAAQTKPEESASLIPIEQVNAVELFTGGGLDGLLGMIEQEAMSLEPSLKTPADRAAIASMAYKVSRSKTTIDDAGKTLVAEWKTKAAAVDSGRKKARDFLDALRDRVRQPLTDWEAEQARMEEEKRLAEEAEKARIAAEAEAALIERERLVREKEEALERAAEEARVAERDRLRREDQEKETQRREEAARQQAKREAEEALQHERDRAEQAERARKEAEEKAERDCIAAAEKAERDRLANVEAERQKAAKEAEERERSRLAEEDRKRREDEARAADKANRERVNTIIIAAFCVTGISEKSANEIVQLVASGSIPYMSIRY